MKGPGKPLKTTPQEMDMLALITPEDVADAQATAKQRMTPRGLALIGSERVEKEDDDNQP